MWKWVHGKLRATAISGCSCTRRSSRTEKFEFRAVFAEPYHSFEGESDFLQYRDRVVVVRRRDRHNARKIENTPTVIQNRGCRFYGITLRTMTRQERESHVGVVQPLAPDQAADSDRRAVAKTGRIQAKSVLGVAVHRTA